VRFAQKLDNDHELSMEMKERIEHNLKYNDDTIFDNISIFRDVEHTPLTHYKQLDVHPSLLKKKGLLG